MSKFLVLVGIGIVALAPVARAQAYVVNGHPASKAEVQYLASYSAPQGQWKVDGFGMSRVADEHPVQPAETHKCWYVLDVKLCD